MAKSKNTKFYVELDRVVLPTGEVKTMFVIPYKHKRNIYIPKPTAINKVLPRINQEYNNFVNKVRALGAHQLSYELSKFLENISKYVIFGGDFINILSKDLKMNKRATLKIVKSTQWMKELIERIQKEKKRKRHPIEYSEAVCQINKIFGIDPTLKLLRKNKISISKSTIRRLCIVACESPKIKKLVRERKIATSLIPLLFKFDQDEKERIAERLISINSYREAKDYIKKTQQKH
ncbi:MAG: hypothetical protein ACP5KW_08605 [Thermoproteota archaeon]